ncbi:hypothetical protein BDZ94DRAFT_1262848 [Collybia nuda]|uniref:Uncharacterized protein n=1 Tax=Collybia nuda TaxID=64659 RepID=A0A9P5Y425_9AGAR|nr:hypothetical protein BDZ94DRAFT_1262848 [Collybia nuda]
MKLPTPLVFVILTLSSFVSASACDKACRPEEPKCEEGFHAELIGKCWVCCLDGSKLA